MSDQVKKGYLRHCVGALVEVGGDAYWVDSAQSASITMLYSEGDEEELRAAGALVAYARDDDYLLGVEIGLTNVRADLELLYLISGGKLLDGEEEYDPEGVEPEITGYEAPTIAEQRASGQAHFQISIYGINYEEGSEIRSGYQKLVLPHAKGRFSGVTIEEGTFSTPEFDIIGLEHYDSEEEEVVSCYRKEFVDALPAEAS